MKIWMKYLLGTIFGVIISLFLPFESEVAQQSLAFFTEISIRIGRFFLIPVLFFGATIAVTKLRISKKLLKTGILSLVVGIVVTLIIVLLGTISVLIVDLPRIPIAGDKTLDLVKTSILDHILLLFPYNGIEGLFNGIYLLPVLFLAAFFGAGFASDPIKAKQSYALFDSLGRVCFLIINFFIDLLAIGLIAISCTWFIDFFALLKTGSYTGLIILLAVDTVVIVCGVLPLLLKLFTKKVNPFKVLYASLSSLFIALFSGDANLSLAVNIRHCKESLGIKRSTGAVSLPLFSVFIRSGSGLVLAVSFIAILQSYSSLEISFTDILFISALSALFSFFLGGIPTGGAFIALTVLCSTYGRGFEAGYLLLKPIAFILCSFGTVIDVAVSMFCTYFIAKKTKTIEEKTCRHFI